MPVVVSKALSDHSWCPSRYCEEGTEAQSGYHNPTALKEQVGQMQFHCEKGRDDNVGKVLHPFLEKHLKEGIALNGLAGKRVRWSRTLTCAGDMKSGISDDAGRHSRSPKGSTCYLRQHFRSDTSFHHIEARRMPPQIQTKSDLGIELSPAAPMEKKWSKGHPVRQSG